ncbi:glutamine--fructose-6-phosphate transaminase (isomerizing) [Candidatus Marinimicrobia bacterium]|nr:glutamine--fructose-6-phosphate transaminase (isomerizing) [Candidatus Neomarinimicrobiota bacterium]
MCGIVAYKGKKVCFPILLNGLKKLEYRGYDSAGVACLMNNKIHITKRAGKVKELENAINNKQSLKNCGGLGIAHTRWATHGEPNQKNAHPHVDASKKITLVHNGIIENYDPIKKFLKSKKIKFKSDTDTEVLVQLIGYFYKDGKLDFEKSVRAALQRVDGAYAIVVLNADFPDMMIAARKGSPLVLGLKDNEFFIGSDVSPIIKHTQQITYLNDSEMAVINGDDYEIKSVDRDVSLPKKVEKIDYKIDDFDKGKFQYFMHKEIHEQVDTILNTLKGRSTKSSVLLHGLSEYWEEIKVAEKIYITACGTSWHAGLIGKNLIERFAEVPVHVEYASEFRYNHSIMDNKTVVIAISQSGETADTLAAIAKANDFGAITIGICNVPGSSVSRETKCGIHTRCGHEIGVASTKAFTAQISVLYLLALKLADSKKKITSHVLKKHLNMSGYEKSAVGLNPYGTKAIKSLLRKEKSINKMAQKYKNASDFLYLGRGLNFPVALEGALKLKEISYIHAEGYPAAEMKHGPIALVDKNMPNVFIVPKDKTYDKIISNIEEIKSRKGKIIIVTDSKDKILRDLADDLILIPKTNQYLFVILATIALQLFSYFIAVAKGCDVDQPRNLAKSVTVE